MKLPRLAGLRVHAVPVVEPVGDVARLLHFEEEDVRADGVNGARFEEDAVARFGREAVERARRCFLVERGAEVVELSRRRRSPRRSCSSRRQRSRITHASVLPNIPGPSFAACSSFGWTWTDSSCRASMNFSNSGNLPCGAVRLADDARRVAREQFAERRARERTIGDAAEVPVHIAEHPRLADWVGVRGFAVQERGQPPPAPEHALEDRLESQRIQGHSHVSDNTLSIHRGRISCQFGASRLAARIT